MKQSEFSTEFLDKSQKEQILPGLFQILAANMTRIAPTGNPLEEDFEVWKEAVYPALERKERQIVLIKKDKKIIGYCQYYINEGRFMVEEVQIERDYWGTGAFRELVRFFAGIIPENTEKIEAYANKNNFRSQKIIKRLGMSIVRENKNRTSYFFSGPCQAILQRYQKLTEKGR